tara:strand:+ start:5306 stop:5833 length:528 start_codon:yes stop_codon:yes gene_type:complete
MFLHHLIGKLKIPIVIFFAAVGVVILGLSIVLFFPIKNAIFGIPYLAIKSPELLPHGGFYVYFEVPCNNMITREIGIIIDPPVKIDSVAAAQSSISGSVDVTIIQDQLELRDIIDLSNSGWSVSGEGIRSKKIIYYPPMGDFFCGDQKIIIKAENTNFVFEDHEITVYISQDRRP